LEKELVVESPPNSFCSLVFNYGDSYFLQNKKYERLKVPLHFIAGHAVYSYKLFLQGKIGIAGIVLKPAALSTFFDLPAFEFIEVRVDTLKVLPHNFIHPCIMQVTQAITIEERVKAMEAFMMQQYEIRKPVTDFIDHAANMIVEKNGMLHVYDLLKDAFMSRRTFERRFFQKVGLSPKYYARIRRIAYLCNLIAGKKKVNWPQIFYECEFYDQAHFIKDFEEFTGRSPQQYLQENSELANFVQKPKTQPLP
jgi:AraC-like DNA-binding protein